MAAALNFIKYWLPVIICGILIFSGSSVPGKNIPQVFAHQDIVAHTLEYAAFALLLSRALKADHPRWGRKKRFLYCFLFSLMFAASDELHQLFVPERLASVKDLFFDGLGIFFAGIFYR